MVDEAALEEHRVAIRGHCYRMLGSAADADDAVQETMARAWRYRDGFAGRSSLRSWLYRIATNVCLSELARRSTRVLPFDDEGAVNDPRDLSQHPREHWVEPIPSALALPFAEDPHHAVALRESVRLAFVAALQHLPAKQRAVLLLRDVLGFTAAEAAECLDSTVAAINSSLQRARATLAERQGTLEAGGDGADEALRRGQRCGRPGPVSTGQGRRPPSRMGADRARVRGRCLPPGAQLPGRGDAVSTLRPAPHDRSR